MTQTPEKIPENRPECARDLSDRQWRFVEEFFVDLNPSKAIQRAGYTGKRVRQSAYETMNVPKVARAIAELAPTYIGMSRAMVLRGMGKIAVHGDSDASRMQALDRLAKISGLYSDGPVSATQITINVYPEEEDV